MCSSRCRRPLRGHNPSRSPPRQKVQTAPGAARPPRPPPPSMPTSHAPWYARCPPWLYLPAPGDRHGACQGRRCVLKLCEANLYVIHGATIPHGPMSGRWDTRRASEETREGRPTPTRTRASNTSALLRDGERGTFLRQADGLSSAPARPLWPAEKARSPSASFEDHHRTGPRSSRGFGERRTRRNGFGASWNLQNHNRLAVARTVGARAESAPVGAAVAAAKARVSASRRSETKRS